MHTIPDLHDVLPITFSFQQCPYFIDLFVNGVHVVRSIFRGEVRRMLPRQLIGIQNGKNIIFLNTPSCLIGIIVFHAIDHFFNIFFKVLLSLLRYGLNQSFNFFNHHSVESLWFFQFWKSIIDLLNWFEVEDFMNVLQNEGNNIGEWVDLSVLG